MDWKISAHVDQRTLCPHQVAPDRNENAAALGAGGVAVGPRMEEIILEQAIRSMKKVGSCLW
jgi:hypothetical protein